MIDPKDFKRFVDAVERIADVFEGTSDTSGLLHVLIRHDDPAEEEEAEEPEDDGSR